MIQYYNTFNSRNVTLEQRPKLSNFTDDMHEYHIHNYYLNLAAAPIKIA